MILISIILILSVAFICAGYYVAYGFIKRLLKENKGQKIVSREFLIFFAVAIPAFFLVIYFMMREPDYFNQAIDQLHSNEYIEHKIGDFNSYSYFKDKMPKDPTKQAVFQVELNSNSTTLYLTCTMKKVDDNWKLVVIKQDSVGNYKR
jgi:hypothetical protein